MRALQLAIRHPYRAVLALVALGAGVSAAGSVFIMWVLNQEDDA